MCFFFPTYKYVCLGYFHIEICMYIFYLYTSLIYITTFIYAHVGRLCLHMAGRVCLHIYLCSCCFVLLDDISIFYRHGAHMHPTVMGESFEDVAPYNAAMNACDKASQWQAWGKGGLLGREVVKQSGACVF